jgi:Ca2+-binding EF-hand superfamily protein
MNLNAMNCPIHNVHSMKHNEGCPFSPKCPHSGPKCAHSKKENNYRNDNDLNNNSNNNSSINNSNNNSNNIPNNNFNHNHQIHNHPYGHFYPHNHHFPKNAPNKNSPNNSITYSYQDPNNNYPNNEGQDSDNDFNNQSKDNNVPNSNENQNNNNGQNNNQYNKGPKGNQYNNGPKNNESSNDNDYNNNIPNNEKNENDSDNDNIPYGNQYDNNIQNPNPNQNENQGYPNNSCPLSPVSSAFPPNSPFFNANEPGQKSNWVFCPKCNVYHRCPHPGCEHNPSKRTTTHKCIKDEDNQDQVQISNNSSQNMNNPNQNNPQNNINNSNNGPNMSTPNFNNNNFISFNPNAMGSNHGRMNQSQNSKKKPPRKRDVFSSCPYQEELGQFVDFLGFLMEVESKIEDMKIELARREDFNFEDIFRIFEVDGKGYIEPEDLKQGLKLLGLNPTDFDINLLLKRFDLNQQGLLTYSDFFDMVVSFEKKLRNSVQIRPPNSCCPCKSPDVFECDTLIAIKNLFKFIIDCEREINQIRANFDSLRSKYSDVVQFLDYTRRGIITRSDLKLYLTQFNKFITSKECDLLFIRLDKTRSGEVGIDEIENELMFLR